jgi:hypothetical protein
MPFGSWLKRKAKEMREEREFKKGVEAEARSLQKESYRQSYRTRKLKEAKRLGQQRAKPKSGGGFMGTLGKNLLTSDFNLFGTPPKKRTRHRRKR